MGLKNLSIGIEARLRKLANRLVRCLCFLVYASKVAPRLVLEIEASVLEHRSDVLPFVDDFRQLLNNVFDFGQ